MCSSVLWKGLFYSKTSQYHPYARGKILLKTRMVRYLLAFPLGLGAAQSRNKIVVGRLEGRDVEVEDNPRVQAEGATQQHEDEHCNTAFSFSDLHTGLVLEVRSPNI